MTIEGVPENNSKIQNEEHNHTALAKRVILTNAAGDSFPTFTSTGGKTALDVNLTTIDIQIGAVEIKDATTDARAPVDAIKGLKVNLGTDNDITATVTGTVNVSNMIPAVETGLATSAKQLANNHDVNVTNMIPSVETGLATSAKQLADNHNVIVTSAPTTAVTGIFWQITQPVSGTFWQTTQPISGSVSATQSGTWDIGTLSTITNDVNVTATNLDIRDLISASDSISAVQSGIWNIGTLTGITNTVTVDATDLDIRDLDWSSDAVKVYAADENARILDADDAVTTVNYSDSSKDSVSNISTASATLGRKVTDTYNNSGATTLVLTRVVANV